MRECTTPGGPEECCDIDCPACNEISPWGCTAVGVMGHHGEGYSDPDDGMCEWCGALSPNLEVPDEP